MIGMDFPVKPEWIHDVHALWRPGRSIGELIEAALAHTMQELGGEKTRRNSLIIILRYYVTTEGMGQQRKTASQDVWVAYSRMYPPSTMAPAYLMHLVTRNEVAHSISKFIQTRYRPGDTFSSGEIRRYVSGQFGERKVVLNAGSAFLRTLVFFGVLAEEEKAGRYLFKAPLAISREIFPLVVWSWWQSRGAPQIDLNEFEDVMDSSLVRHSSSAGFWQAYPSLWTLEERLESRRVVLRHGSNGSFEEALLALLLAREED
ncbi:MAG: hypothetical protein JXA42_09825 [Anaerolineales bacterium]|nr:hypothetical protein [Anaerolineales bacterium]